MSIRQSFCYRLFQPEGMSLDTLCAHAAAIGYAGVELWWPEDDFEELIAAANRHGLTVASMCGHHWQTGGLNDRAQHDRIEGELRASIEQAQAHRIPGLICFSGNRIEGQSDREAIEAVAAGLRRVTPAAEKARINLNLELLNSKINHPGYQCDHTAWGAAVCERVGSPRAKLLYDIYHMQIMEGDVIHTMTDHLELIGHVHTAGVPGRRDLDDQQELNYSAICGALADAGYAGFVGHEFKPKADFLAALRAGFEVCDAKEKGVRNEWHCRRIWGGDDVARPSARPVSEKTFGLA